MCREIIYFMGIRDFADDLTKPGIGVYINLKR